MISKVIFPILNKRFTSFRGPQWYLSDNLSVKSISDEEYGVVASSENKLLTDIVGPGRKCISWNLNDEDVTEKQVEQVLASSLFAINIFLESGGVVAPFAVHLIKKRKTRLKETYEFPYYGGLRQHAFERLKFDNGLQPLAVQTVFGLAASCLTNRPQTLIMLKRFNMSFTRTDPVDQMIDIAIALEHLIEGNTELTYRLCLTMAVLAAQTEDEKAATYSLFKRFYSVRSKVVHGIVDQADNSVQRVIEELPNVRKIGSVAVLEFLKFFEETNQGNWGLHCRNKILNIPENVN